MPTYKLKKGVKLKKGYKLRGKSAEQKFQEGLKRRRMKARYAKIRNKNA